jgi:hypothetical protein
MTNAQCAMRSANQQMEMGIEKTKLMRKAKFNQGPGCQEGIYHLGCSSMVLKRRSARHSLPLPPSTLAFGLVFILQSQNDDRPRTSVA